MVSRSETVHRVPTRLYPFASHFFERHGLRLHYLDEGAGAPIVMLHGNPTWSFYYRRLVLGLRDRYRCIVPDHIGCGYSDKPTSTAEYDFRLQTRIDDLAALLEALRVRDRLTLVLHDWGGMIGMGYASRFPERIARLIVLNTAAFRLPATKTFPWLLRLGRDWRFGAWLIRRWNFFCRLAAYECVQRRKLSGNVRAAYLAPYQAVDQRLAVLKFVQTIPLSPQDDGYALVQAVEEGLHRFQQVPTLICWGMRDFVFSEEFLHEWRRHLPQAEVHTFSDCGHYLLEDAAVEVLPIIRSFLDRHPLLQ